MHHLFTRISLASLFALATYNLPAQPVSFRHAPPILTAGGPVSFAVADFNGDGIPDVVTVGPTISVYLGNGDGTFASPVVSSGAQALGVLVGDFNNDHKPDLVLFNITMDEYSMVLLGNGDGTFQAPLPLEFSAQFAAAGDFNHDGNLDLAFATPSALLVLLGDGAGNFPRSVIIPVTSAGGLAAGSLSGNHHLDLVVSNPGSNAISVYLGNGDGTFGSPRSITVGQSPGPVAIHDMNGDGTNDIVVADTQSDDVTVILGKPDGTFWHIAAFEAPANTLQSLAIADFNNDGIPDVAVAGFLLFGTGKGDLGTPVAYPTVVGSFAVIAADLNGDKKPDLLTIANAFFNEPASVSILLGKGNGTFEGAPEVSVGTVPVSIVAADFNGDGQQDLVVADQGSHSLSVLLGNGHGSFAPAQTVSLPFSPAQLVARDFNGDGKMDLVAICYESADCSYAVLLGDGTGNFPAPMLVYDGFPEVLTVGDFNGDGIPDLVLGSSGGVSIAIGNGDGTFKISTPITSQSVVSLAVGDINRDGKLDIVVGEFGSPGAFTLLLGKGDGTFTTGGTLSASTYPDSALVADVNGDGKPDVLLAGGTDVAVFLGNGDGTFHPESIAANELGSLGDSLLPQGMVAADFNQDGKMDLAVISQISVSILAGNGDGTFQPAQVFGTNFSPAAIAKGSFNPDNKPDLAVVNSGANTVSLLLNTTP